MIWRDVGGLRNVIGVELLMVVGCLAVPVFRQTSLQHHAQRVVTDVRLAITAANQARARLGAWPADEEAGHVPPALKPFLPHDFAFDHPEYSLDWDHWLVSDGPTMFAKRGQFLGMSVTTRDRRLFRRVVELLGNEPLHFTVGDRSTIQIADATLSSLGDRSATPIHDPTLPVDDDRSTSLPDSSQDPGGASVGSVADSTLSAH